MSNSFKSFVDSIVALSQILPLEVFVFVGSVIEEVFGPIPSPLIMTSAGGLAVTQNRGLWYLLLLAVISAVGKMFVSFGLYYLGDKAEDIVVHKYGKYLGVQQSSIDKLRSYFSKDWRDDLILFLLRAIPIFPTGTVSIVCGVLKITMRSFVIASTLGFIVRGLIFLVIGFYGLEQYQEGISFISSSELLTLLGAALVFSIVFMLYRNQRVRDYVQKMKDRLEKKS